MKRIINLLIIILAFVLIWNCGSTKNEDVRYSKEKQLNELKQHLAAKSFKFIAETAHPMQTYAVTQVTNALLRNTGNTAGTIFLTGRGDYMKLMGDTITAELSYFGESRIVSSTDPRDTGINFEAKALNFTTTENKNKKSLNLEFDVKTKTDYYNIIMRIYPNKRTNIIVNSANRTSIRYGGEIEILEEKEKAPK